LKIVTASSVLMREIAANVPAWRCRAREKPDVEAGHRGTEGRQGESDAEGVCNASRRENYTQSTMPPRHADSLVSSEQLAHLAWRARDVASLDMARDGMISWE
jgi:hypothetical protein